MKKILITAYDIDPYRGSESATGWNFVREASRKNRVVAVTRYNNKSNIDKFVAEKKVDITNLEFRYFDLPKYARFWKRGPRGSFLYSYLWQLFVSLWVYPSRKSFDLVHSLNFHCDWLPSFLWLLNRPFVWGPINHNERVPNSFLVRYGFIVVVKENFKWLVKLFFWFFDPFLWLCRLRCNCILQGHAMVAKRLMVASDGVITFSQIASEEIIYKSEKSFEKRNGFRIISVGRFLPIKGFDLVIDAFSRFCSELAWEHREQVELIIVGDGAWKNLIHSLVKRYDVEDRVVFKGWVNKDEVIDLMANANVFCFPSHEGAGMVCAESMSVGTPVICFDNYGPASVLGEQGVIKVNCDTYQNAVINISNELLKMFYDIDYEKKLSVDAHYNFMERHSWRSKGSALNRVYEKVS